MDAEKKCRDLETEIDSTITNLEREAEAAKEKMFLADTEVHEFETTLSETSGRLSELEKKLEDQTKDSKRMDDPNQELKRIAIEWEAARAGLEDASKSLKKLGEDPGEELDKVKSKLDDIKSEPDTARDQTATQNGVLASRTDLAPYSKLADIEEKIAALEIREREEWIRIDGIKMLKEVLDQCCKEALEAVTAPVQNRASEIFKTISDDRLGHVILDENFQPVGVLPAIMNETVRLENLSGGELEQIPLATRLALAETLRRDDREVVILDDILTATDSIRIDKIMEVFKEASKSIQIVILTCHPECYSKLKDAKNLAFNRTWQRENVPERLEEKDFHMNSCSVENYWATAVNLI